MTHRTSGLYRFLEVPALYESFQQFLGADAARKRFVARFLHPAPGAKILDIGCGPGAFLEYLPADVDYTGYDLNASYIEAARRRYGARARFHHARIGEEPAELEPSSFDLVIAKGILHHLADEEARQLFRTAFRYLRPGGFVVSLDGVRHDGQRALARLILSLDRGRAIRDPAGYERLAREHTSAVEGALITNWLAVPYSYYIMRAERVE
jgi:cyclopropane fatty-acyl-phospholipid synthase-like methyltransferase